MPSVFTLTSSVAFPVGMVVRAYPRSAFPTSIVQGVAPPVAPVSAAVMQDDGRAVFADLDHGSLYVAGARVDGQWAYVQFRTVDSGAGSSEPGAPGASAYDLWLQAGHTGSESDFLASLRGPQGIQGGQGPQGGTGPQGASVTGAKGADGRDGSAGAAGTSAYQAWLDAGNTGTQAAFLASLKGLAGSNGTNGSNGSNGANGTSFALGSPQPVSITASATPTAFQPVTSGAKCALNVMPTVTALVALTGSVSVSIAASSGGTYLEVAKGSFALALGATDSRTISLMVPDGWWVKVTASSATLVGSLTLKGIAWQV